MNEFQHFVRQLWDNVSPILACIWAFFFWMMFPDAAYIPAAIAVGIAIGLDLFTKLYALARKNGGYLKAIDKHIIKSDTLWRKTSIKLYSYLVIFILAGLSARVTPLEIVGVGVATFAYSVIFIRELQSNAENLIEAGADWLRPFLSWTKQKEKDIYVQAGIAPEQKNENMEG
ncbi:MAG: hypothetical protein K0R80_166 [Clostridia bacterium]|jgi:hypothetical protein|nr:hypothetical protein [Clostridia bacterium]